MAAMRHMTSSVFSRKPALRRASSIGGRWKGCPICILKRRPAQLAPGGESTFGARDGDRHDGHVDFMRQVCDAGLAARHAAGLAARAFGRHAEDVAAGEPGHGSGHRMPVDLAAFDENRMAHAQDQPEKRMAGVFLGRPAGDVLAADDAEDQRQVEVAQVVDGQDVGAGGGQVVEADDDRAWRAAPRPC